MDKNETLRGNEQKIRTTDNPSLMTDSPVLRYNEFLEELDGDNILSAELYDSFVEDTIRRLKEAGEALDSRDIERLHREAHTIKGGALSLMADNLAEHAFRLEQSAKAGLAISSNPDKDNLKKKLNELEIALNRFSKAWKLIRENNETD